MIPAIEETGAIPRNGLNALLSAAVRSSPDALLFSDDAGGTTARDLSDQVRGLAHAFRSMGLVAGERVLILAAPTVASLVAIMAALRIGLEPAVMPPSLNAVGMAACAAAARAAALIGPSRIGELQMGEAYSEAAALSDTIRLLASQGPEPVDGALDLSLEALRTINPPSDDEEIIEAPMIATFGGLAKVPRLVSHRQAAMFADALSLVEQAKINPTKRIVSLLPPATLAGLVAGPFAALVGASSLALSGPFAARAFLEACDAEPGCHLVVPAAVGFLFAEPQLSESLSSLILMSRHRSVDSFALPVSVECRRLLVDLYAFGEDTLLAQRRLDASARPPSRIADRNLTDGLGAKLNRARAETRTFDPSGR